MSRAPWLGALAVAALYAVPWMLDTVRLRMVIEILYFGLFAVSFNLLFGYAGLLSFGHAASFGVGGYAVGLVLKHVAGVPLVVAMALGALAGALAGLLIGAFCVRLRGTYFALLTLAFSQFLNAIALKWRDVTRGDDGLTVAVPDITLPGGTVIRMASAANFYWLALTIVLLSLWAAWRFTRTPLGNAGVLMRENDERAAFLGYNVFATKLIMFTVASGFAAVAGVLFATFQRLISPAALDLPIGTEVVFMAVLGGTGAFLGPFLGAAVYIVVQDWLSKTSEHWPFFMGLAFVLMILFAHTGLVGLLGALTGWRRGPVPQATPARPETA
ncbi:MAG TPA: branched-chain amino acid ABC transporter permease [Methylomirabilota bacterium]|jgi:branched-chain amino acid transport system permease protein|nr:branched-chain amino acid ABC transporter permease [Methylomirabilota bacterium]